MNLYKRICSYFEPAFANETRVVSRAMKKYGLENFSAESALFVYLTGIEHCPYDQEYPSNKIREFTFYLEVLYFIFKSGFKYGESGHMQSLSRFYTRGGEGASLNRLGFPASSSFSFKRRKIAARTETGAIKNKIIYVYMVRRIGIGIGSGARETLIYKDISVKKISKDLNISTQSINSCLREPLQKLFGILRISYVKPSMYQLKIKINLLDKNTIQNILKTKKTTV